MERLTILNKKIFDEEEIKYYQINNNPNNNTINLHTAIEKLGTIEDLEEELGIDLITLFKALKDGIYVKDDNYGCRGVSEHKGQEIELNIFLKRLEIKFVGCWDLSDYKKTWWLKEDLEDEKEAQKYVDYLNSKE